MAEAKAGRKIEWAEWPTRSILNDRHRWHDAVRQEQFIGCGRVGKSGARPDAETEARRRIERAERAHSIDPATNSAACTAPRVGISYLVTSMMKRVTP